VVFHNTTEDPMPDFPTESKRTQWSVWRGDTWLGEWHKKPRVGEKIKPRECLLSKTVTGIDNTTGRIFVK
jgi:hypothetical protein